MSQETRLLLILLALAAASAAQAAVERQPWLSLAGFSLAIVLVCMRGRDKLGARTRERNVETPVVPPAFWLLLSTGLALCATAGVAVAADAIPLLTHALWAAGLLCLAAGAVGTARGRERQQRAWLEVATIVLLVLACAALFGWHLTTIPPEVHGDDAEVGLDALRLLESTPFNLFRTSWFRLPIFHALPTAIGLEIFGVDLLGLRATSAVIGTITVLLTFELARRLWNLEVAVASAILLATGRYFIHLSRAGYHYVDTPCASVAVLLLFLTAWRARRLGAAVWCGIGLGLSVQTYYASRLIPVLLCATWLLWLWRSDATRRRARLATFLLTFIVAVATAAPMIGYFAHHWIDLWQRSIDTSIFNPGAADHLAAGFPGQSLAHIVLVQLRDALLLFNVTPDTSVQYGYRHPLLEPITGVFFVLGFAGSCAAAATRRAQLLLLWIVVPVILGGALTIDAPFFPRVSGVLPFVAITIALALSQLLNGLRAVLRGAARGGAASLPRATRSQARGVVTMVVTGLIAAAIVSAATFNNLRAYFVDYAPHHRHGPAVEIAHWITANGAGRTTYMIGGVPQFSIRHGAIQFMTHGLATRDIKDLDEELRTNQLDPASSRFVIVANGAHYLRRLQDALGPMEVVPHRDRHTVLFYTAIPTTQLTAAAVPPSVISTLPEPSFATPRRTSGRLSAEPPAWIAAVFVAACAISVVALAWLARGAFVTRRTRDHRPRDRWYARVFWSALGSATADTSQREPSRLFTGMALTLIVAIAIALRVYQLAQLPAGFYCDEAGLGYNAWSIIQTGRDETGARSPLFIWSFDTSYKNPVWLYSAVLPISVLGLNEFAVRITSAAYGSATIVAMFFLGRALLSTWGGLLAAGILAVCPWHLHFSRIAFELITFPFFFLWGVTCFVRSLQGRRWFPLAALLFGYSLYTYAIAKVFVPIFVVGCLVLFRRELWQRRREALLAAGVLVITTIPLVVFDLQNHERAGHYFADTSVFSAPQPALQIAGRIVWQYLSFFSPDFLFVRGDRVVRHAVQGHGELYLLFAPFLVLGLIVAWRRRTPTQRLILMWLLLYPIAPALMSEAPTASRGIIGAPAFCLLIALGAETLWRIIPRMSMGAQVGRIRQWVLVGGGLALLALHVQYYWRLYSEDYPLYAAKYYTGFQYGHREVIDYFQTHRDEYDLMVLTAHRSNQAQIFPLFYGKFPPALFQDDPEGALRRNAKTQVGWLKEMERFEQYNRLLFAVTDDELDDVADYDERARIIAPDGTPAFVLIDVFPGRNFIRSWIVGGPYPADDDSPPPLSDPEDPLPAVGPGSGWREVRSDDPEVDLNNVFTPNADEACAWAVNAVTSPVERTVRVRAGFDDAGQVWVNGERLDLEIQHRPDAPLVDPHVGEAILHPGRNVVAVRSCEIFGDWYFYVHFTESNGQPVQGLEWER